MGYFVKPKNKHEYIIEDTDRKNIGILRGGTFDGAEVYMPGSVVDNFIHKDYTPVDIYRPYEPGSVMHPGQSLMYNGGTAVRMPGVFINAPLRVYFTCSERNRNIHGQDIRGDAMEMPEIEMVRAVSISRERSERRVEAEQIAYY